MAQSEDLSGILDHISKGEYTEAELQMLRKKPFINNMTRGAAWGLSALLGKSNIPYSVSQCPIRPCSFHAEHLHGHRWGQGVMKPVPLELNL